jgi:hypothetical protein
MTTTPPNTPNRHTHPRARVLCVCVCVCVCVCCVLCVVCCVLCVVCCVLCVVCCVLCVVCCVCVSCVVWCGVVWCVVCGVWWVVCGVWYVLCVCCVRVRVLSRPGGAGASRGFLAAAAGTTPTGAGAFRLRDSGVKRLVRASFALGHSVDAFGLFVNNINARGRVYAMRDTVHGANPEQQGSEVPH